MDTTEAEHDIELKRDAEESKWHTMTNVHDFVEMWQCSQNPHATQQELRAQHKQMTAEGYILDTENIVNAFWINFQRDGVGAL
jgi:DNA polymerase IIIc chi subunit